MGQPRVPIRDKIMDYLYVTDQHTRGRSWKSIAKEIRMPPYKLDMLVFSFGPEGRRLFGQYHDYRLVHWLLTESLRSIAERGK